MSEAERPVPQLFFNVSEEDKGAVREILRSGILCDLNGPLAEERTPLLVCGSMRFYGLHGIKKFIALREEEKVLETRRYCKHCGGEEHYTSEHY